MDGARIKQVLLNLVGNAVKFTPEGGRVWVRADSEDGAVRVEVGDTGPGIAAEDHERIFLEFQQAGATLENRKGPAWGLRWRRSSWRCMAARFGLKAKSAKGSRFFFTLPIDLLGVMETIDSIAKNGESMAGQGPQRMSKGSKETPRTNEN